MIFEFCHASLSVTASRLCYNGYFVRSSASSPQSVFFKEPFSPHGRDLVTSSNPPFQGVAKIAVIKAFWKSLSIHNTF